MITTGEPLNKISGIYAAIHRDSGMCYVGSSVNIGRRLKQHLLASEKGNDCAFHRAISSCGSSSFDFEVLELCDVSELREKERFYIALLGGCSEDGFNTCARPGLPNYGYSPSEATRARLSAYGKRKVFSDKTKARISEARKGSNNRKGTRHSEETKAKIAAAQKGKTRWTLKQRIQMGIDRKGRKASDETRLKMSASGKLKIFTQEHKENLRIALHKRLKLTMQ